MKIRLCDKCAALARFHVESLDLAFCTHHWNEVEPKLMSRVGMAVLDYRDNPIPDHQPSQEIASLVSSTTG